MIKKHLVALAAVLLSCVAFSRVETVQVIQAPSTPPRPDSAGASFGKGLGDGFSRGIEAALAQRMAEERDQKRIREELAKKRALQDAKEASCRRKAEVLAAEQEKNNKIIHDILDGYTKEKKSEYVLRILQSPLPMKIKQCVIDILNGQALDSAETTRK